jgi:hypothetical protein
MIVLAYKRRSLDRDHRVPPLIRAISSAVRQRFRLDFGAPLFLAWADRWKSARHMVRHGNMAAFGGRLADPVLARGVVIIAWGDVRFWGQSGHRCDFA